MKNWLIEKLGGVSVSKYVGDIENVARATNVLIEVQDSKISKLKSGKTEMEEAGKSMSERISELIDKLNEERKVSNGLMAKMTAQSQKIEELQAEIEAKNAELARVKSEVIAISKVKAGTALSAKNQRLRAEVELLKRIKFKRGRK